ncbi:MAG: hypothetical protein U1E27_13460, partial [Kiritimatiellia bacterium]|nr:hypothetical protein [Kiritimatiellia bacterium]
ISIPPRSNTSRTTLAEHKQAIAAIRAHIEANNLRDRINYIVVTPQIGVFATDDTPGGDGYTLFDRNLMVQLAEPGVNPINGNTFSENANGHWNNLRRHAFSRQRYGYSMVTRIDGPGGEQLRDMIDATGAPAFHSHTNGIRLLVNNPDLADSHRESTLAWAREFRDRGNVLLNEDWFENPKGRLADHKNTDPTYNSDPLWNESKIMFANLDYVTVTGITDPPFLYSHWNFLPGSSLEIVRSFPGRNMTRLRGGIVRVLLSSLSRTHLRFDDGSDFHYRAAETLAWDPSRDRIWVGTGQKKENEGFTEFIDRLRGNGLAVIDAQSGRRIAYFNRDNSNLINNRVLKVAHDPHRDRLWIASYGGIQYVDLTDHSIHSIPGLTNAHAAAMDIYVSPYPPHYAYATFLYAHGSARDSQLTNFRNRIFEINGDADTFTALQVGSVAGHWRTPVAMTDSQTVWMVRTDWVDGTNMPSAVRYNRVTKQVVATEDLFQYIPEAVADLERYPRVVFAHINSQGQKRVYIAFSTVRTDRLAYRKNYLLRITETGAATHSVSLLQRSSWNDTTADAGERRYNIRHMATDPANPDHLYLAMSKQLTSDSTHRSRIERSTDGNGGGWEEVIGTSHSIHNLNEILLDGRGNLFGAQGNHDDQSHASDYIAFGCSSTGGGLTHDHFEYAQDTSGLEAGMFWSDPDFVQTNNPSPVAGEFTGYMYKMLNGYSMLDARSARNGFPSTGFMGWMKVTLVVEPKTAPFAPRVDDAQTAFLLPATNALRARLHSPGLPAAGTYADGFDSGTINRDTVALYNDRGEYLAPSTVTYDSATQELVYTRSSNLSPGVYFLWLRCGPGGIKNRFGGAL